MKRLFIAANVSDEARSIAAGIVCDLRREFPVKGVGWVKPENLHVTIKFLGDTDESMEKDLIETLDRITSTFAPFRLQLAGPEVLSKRVISVAVRTDSAAVFSLEMVIDTKCERLGFPREGRRFHPHLTLARIRDPRNSAPLVAQFLKTHIKPAEFEVREIVLFESRLTKNGSVYSVVKTFELQN